MGYRFYSDAFFFSFFFSCIFCVICSFVDSLMGFWVFLELCGLSLIPSFFYFISSSVFGFYSSLLTYVIMSGLSSVLLVTGIIFSGFYYFVFFGFVVKFGLFPFSLWMYRVFSESNWVFIFLLSVVMKFPVLFFCFLYENSNFYLVYVDCGITVLMCSLYIWFFSRDWEYIWCHISLSSVATLVVACFCNSVSVCFFIYFYYFFWGSLCLFYFYCLGSNSFSGSFWVYCFLLLVTPVSLPLFYKLSVCVGVVYSSVYVLLAWCLYSFSEQFFLYKLASDCFYSGVSNDWLDL